MYSSLDRQVVEVLDAGEQPEAPYYLIIGTERLGYYTIAVDRFSVGPRGVRGYVGKECVCVCPPSAEVLVVARSRTRLVPYRERLRYALKDQQQVHEFLSEARPQTVAPSETRGPYL